MGWISQIASRLGGGLVPEAEWVCEPVGFDGEWVTVADASGNPICGFDKKPFRLRCNGRTVYATRQEAIAEARKRVEAKKSQTDNQGA